MESRLARGLIPAHTECPYKKECDSGEFCYHKGTEHNVDFSCGIARLLDMINRNKNEPKRI